MTRELKFRAWDGIGNYGMQYYDSIEELVVYFSPHKFQEVMQYTGLKDKTGKEIYEGDLLGVKSFSFLHMLVVIYDNEKAGFRLGCDFASIYEAVDFYSLEVIGNIHENPELID